MKNPVQLLKLLSNETRLRILLLLERESLCVCQLTGILGESQPTVSKTLARLRDLGLVTDHPQDRFVYYRLKDDAQLKTFLDAVRKEPKAFPVMLEDERGLTGKEAYLDNCSTISRDEKADGRRRSE